MTWNIGFTWDIGVKTHRDGFPWFSAGRARRGDAGHRKTGAPSTSIGTSARVSAGESHGKPPSRSRPLVPGGRQEAAGDAPQDPRLPSYPAKSGHDFYGSLSLILGIGHVRAARRKLQEATGAFEHAALNPPFLLNGGALVVVLAYIKSAGAERISSNLAIYAVACWGLGLLSAAFAIACGRCSKTA